MQRADLIDLILLKYMCDSIELQLFETSLAANHFEICVDDVVSVDTPVDLKRFMEEQGLVNVEVLLVQQKYIRLDQLKYHLYQFSDRFDHRKSRRLIVGGLEDLQKDLSGKFFPVLSVEE